MDNVKEALELYFETLSKEEKKELLRQRVMGIQKVKALPKIIPLPSHKVIKTLEKARFKSSGKKAPI